MLGQTRVKRCSGVRDATSRDEVTLMEWLWPNTSADYFNCSEGVVVYKIIATPLHSRRVNFKEYTSNTI